MIRSKQTKGKLSWFILLIVLIAAITALFLLPGFSHSPAQQFQELKSARSELEIIKSKRVALETLLNSKADYELKWHNLKEEAELHQKQLPPLSAQTETIAGLEKVLTSVPGEIRHLVVGPLTHSDYYSSLTLQLLYAGSSLQAEELLQAIENFSAILVIESLHYNLSDISGVELNLNLKLYFNNETGGNFTGSIISRSFFFEVDTGE